MAPARAEAARRRRVGGWGFQGEAVAPPYRLVDWLSAALGPAQPRPALPWASQDLPPPGALPTLPCESSEDPWDRLFHARGQGLPDLLRLRSGEVPPVPDAVIRPAGPDEVAAVLRACGEAGVRVIPWGGGTSVTGGLNVPSDGLPTVSLDLERLSGLESLDPVSGIAWFGAGTRGPQLESALAGHGFTLGHFPQSWELSTLGGWVVTRSSGQQSLGYGRIEDLTAGLELVAPAGRLELSAQPASAAGPDLRHLVLGSEGRFGVVTRVAVRLRPRPPGQEARAWLLPGWAEGVEAVRRLIQGGAPLSMLRLSDATETDAALALGLAARPGAALVRRYLAWRKVGRGCLLLAGAVGERRTLRQALGEVTSSLRPRGAVALGESPGRRWLEDRFRHPYLRDALLDLGYATDTLETAAPWSLLERLEGAVREALVTGLEGEGEKVLVLCHLSHPYRDGASLYFTFFFRFPSDPAVALARWARLKRAATEALVGAGGTLSHHHGVGRWHAPWLAREVGETGVELLRSCAETLDPNGILNPQVLLDPTDRLES